MAAHKSITMSDIANRLNISTVSVSKALKNKEGIISIDKTGKAPGRGAYICDSIECLEKAIKTKRLERTFGMQISSDIYENLRGVIIDKE